MPKLVPKTWRLLPFDRGAADQLASQLGITSVSAQLLLNRGYRDVHSARRFLEAPLSDLEPPHRLPGATEAAERLRWAVEKKRRMMIYGDYDVDGVCATAILYRLLRFLDGHSKPLGTKLLRPSPGLARCGYDGKTENDAEEPEGVSPGTKTLAAHFGSASSRAKFAVQRAHASPCPPTAQDKAKRHARGSHGGSDHRYPIYRRHNVAKPGQNEISGRSVSSGRADVCPCSSCHPGQ
jgi:hypothetical protein